MIDNCKKKIQIGFAVNYSIFLAKFTFQPSVATLIYSTNFNILDLWPIDKKIDQFIEIIHGLALSIRILQSMAGISNGNYKTAIALIILCFFPPSKFTTISRPDWPKKVTKYFYCWAPDYYLKKHCSIF